MPSHPFHPSRRPGARARGGWLLALAVLLALLGGLGWGARTLYLEREQRYHYIIESGLLAINQLQVRSVASWYQHRLGEAQALGNDAALAAAVARWRNQPTAEREARLRERLRGLVERLQYSGAYLVDADGRLLLAWQGQAAGALPPAERELLHQAQAASAGLQRSERFAFPYLSLVAPLRDGPQLLGAVWLVVDARLGLYPLLEAWPGGSRTTAESMLVQRQGDGVLFLSPLRHRSDPPLSLRLPLQEYADAPAVRAAQGARGTLYGRDYRREPVLAAAAAVPGSDWLLLSEIDTSEAFVDARQGGWLSLTLYVGLSLLLLGTLVLLRQWRAWQRERALKERLQDNMRWLEAAQRAASLGYFSYDAERRQFTMSAMANAIFGLPAQACMTLKEWIAMMEPADREAMLREHGRAMSERSPLRVHYRIHPQDGRPLRWVEVRAEFAGGQAGGRNHMTGTVQDITERRQAEQQLEHYRVALEAQVRIDPLTQLANRLALDECLGLEWARAARAGTPLALLMIDVDCFKAFNDCYGHVAGDRCLHGVAQVLALGTGRVGDMVARYGGEEFAVLLPGADDAQALAAAERLRLGVRALALEHAQGASDAGVVSISIGVASVLPQALDGAGGHGGHAGSALGAAQLLLRRADAALYRAKQGGRDQSVVYDESCEAALHEPPDSLFQG